MKKQTRRMIRLCTVALMGIMMCACSKNDNVKGIQHTFQATEGLHEAYIGYADSLLNVYKLTSEVEEKYDNKTAEDAMGEITLPMFRTRVGISERELDSAVESLVGTKDIRKTPNYEAHRSLFAYYHIDDITSYYFWLHTDDMADAYMNIVHEVYKERLSEQNVDEKIDAVTKDIQAFEEEEKSVVTAYLDALEALRAFCDKPSDLEEGTQVLSLLKASRRDFAESVKNRYIQDINDTGKQ